MRYLNQLEVPWWVVNNTSELHLMGNSSLKFNVCVPIQLDTGEQVVDQAEEERLILIHLKHTERFTYTVSADTVPYYPWW